MRKRGVFLLFLLLIFAMHVASAQAGNDSEARAYECLTNLVENKTTLSLEDSVFSVLALGRKNNLIQIIEDNKNPTENCWPKRICDLKKTAQVALAYDKAGESNSEIIEWLSNKNSTPDDLNWFLQIDVSDHVASQCTINYGDSSARINILDDMSLEEGNSGACLEIYNSYWLKVNDNCLDKIFDISCDKGFTTSILYQKKEGETVYVTETTLSSVSGGTTTQEINVKCLSSGGSCDYEGNLWAVLALSREGKSVSEYIPYLIALSDDNKAFFPSAFLYILTSQQEYYNDIIQKQNPAESYWSIIGSPFGRFYDTALGLVSLGGAGGSNVDSAKSYLEDVQGKDGCWNNKNVRDTAFLLYSGWPKSATRVDGGGSVIENCEPNSGYCELRTACETEGGEIDSDKFCSFGEVCCSIDVHYETCSSLLGDICDSDENCDAETVPSDDGPCCLGTCEEGVISETCETFGAGTCKPAGGCLENEEEDINETCALPGEVCCVEGKKKGFGWIFWIILLIILIALTVLGIKYKDKIRLWWFKIRKKTKVTPVAKSAYPAARVAPTGARTAVPPRFARRPAGRPLPTRRKVLTKKEKEFEETLKKLKEMGK